jgi:hypothetical protein
VILASGIRQAEALPLCESLGYERTEPDGHHIGNPVSVCFKRKL